MAISYQKHGNLIYGTVCTVRREGKKVIKEYGEQLGRLIDKERLVFFSKSHGGLFQYDEKTGNHLPPPDDVKAPERKSSLKVTARPVSLSFGAVYLLDSFMKKSGLYAVFENVFADKSDQLKGMICFYILSSLSNQHADDWLQGNIGFKLFPKASLSDPQLSSFLEYIGDNRHRQLFLVSYLDWLKKHCPDDSDGSILIDSTGLPRSDHFLLTAISSHNDDINEEVRLIYVVQQATGLPVFYRVIPGNIVDVSAIERITAELQILGFEISCTVADAGYYSDSDIARFNHEKNAFLLRILPDHTLYKKIAVRHLPSIKDEGVLVKQNNRLVRVKRIPCKLCEKLNHRGDIIEGGFDGYAYLCVDEQRKAFEMYKLGEMVADNSLAIEKYDEAQEELGVFMLISSKSIDPQEVLAIFYSRDQIEQDFDFCRNYAGMLPLNIQREEIFNGHMMLTFIATIVIKMLQNKLKQTDESIKALLEILHQDNCVQHGEKYITCEPGKKARVAYEALGIEYPISVSIK